MSDQKLTPRQNEIVSETLAAIVRARATPDGWGEPNSYLLDDLPAIRQALVAELGAVTEATDPAPKSVARSICG